MLGQEIHLQKTQMQECCSISHLRRIALLLPLGIIKRPQMPKHVFLKILLMFTVDGGIEQLQTVFEGLQWQES